jgi:hypothetical protein
VNVALLVMFVVLAGAVGVRILSVVITKHVVTVIKFVVTEHVVLKVNSAIMACVLIAIHCATLMKHAVLRLLVAENALGGNVAIAQMHVHNSKHAPMVFVANLKTV